MCRRQTSDEPGLERLYLRVFINDVVCDPAEDRLGGGAGGSDEDVAARAGGTELSTGLVHLTLGLGQGGIALDDGKIVQKRPKLRIAEHVGERWSGGGKLLIDKFLDDANR